MNNPVFQLVSIRLACTVLLVCTATLRAESPENRSTKKRTKPQIIYHLPPSSPYAQRLHSQAKGQNNNELPVDGSMPLSLQTSHANAGAEAAPPQSATPPPQDHNVKPRMRSSREQPRPHSLAKPSGHGKGHGDHSRKK